MNVIPSLSRRAENATGLLNAFKFTWGSTESRKPESGIRKPETRIIRNLGELQQLIHNG